MKAKEALLSKFFGKSFPADTMELHLLKQAVNYFVPGLLRNAPPEKATWPVSQLTERIFKRLDKALIFERDKGLLKADNMHLNLQYFLQAAKQAGVYVSERDCYYRYWLGYFFMVVFEEMEKAFLRFNPFELEEFRQIPELEKVLEAPGSRRLLFYWWLTGHLAFVEPGKISRENVERRIVAVELETAKGGRE